MPQHERLIRDARAGPLAGGADAAVALAAHEYTTAA